MFDWRKGLVFAVLFLTIVLGACSEQEQVKSPTAVPGEDAIVEPTALPEILIVEREQLIVGVDASLPPFVDLNSDGEIVGLEVDLFSELAGMAAIDYRYVSTEWDTVFLDLVGGRFDAVMGGVTRADVPANLVDLTDPYFEMGQVAVVLASNPNILRLEDLTNATVGVESLSWGEFAISGDGAVLPLPAGKIRRFESSPELIQALLDGFVDAIVTNHTVIESYMEVNPGDLRVLPAQPGSAGDPDAPDTWLSTHSFHIAVPEGANELLATLNTAIAQLKSDGRSHEVIQAWGFAPTFAARPRFFQNPSAATLIAGIEKVDDYTVRFVLNRPDPNFDYKMAVPAMAIHSPSNLEQYEGGGELSENPVGSGPFLLEEWEQGEAITLSINLDYWGELPLIETIVITGVRDAAARYTLLRASQVQMVENLGAEELDSLEESENRDLVVYQRAPVNVAFLGMSRDLAPFDDLNLRLAIATCIDQPDLVETLYPTGTLIASQFVPPNTFGFTPGLLWYEQDTERAGELLDLTDYPDGLEVELNLVDLPSDFLPEPVRIAEAIQTQLSACGITVTLSILDADLFEQRLIDGQLAFHLGGWSADFPGPIGFLNAHFLGVGNGGQFGAPYPAIVDRLEQAAHTSDRGTRQELYDQVNQLLKEKAIFVPLAHGGSNLVARADLPGVVTNPVRRESLASIGPITNTAPYTRFVVAMSRLPVSLDPSDEVDDATFAVTNQIFETLVDFEPATTVLTAGLAIAWSANEAADVWEFTLRPGVRFHDGTDFNADAVLLNFERLWDPEHPYHNGRTGAFRYFQILFGAFREPQ